MFKPYLFSERFGLQHVIRAVMIGNILWMSFMRSHYLRDLAFPVLRKIKHDGFSIDLTWLLFSTVVALVLMLPFAVAALSDRSMLLTISLCVVEIAAFGFTVHSLLQRAF